MITASAEFKALWHKKVGNVEKTRIRYKRRYKNAAGSWVNEPDWAVLEEEDFIGIGRIPQALDVPFRNIFRIGTVTLRFPNLYNEWLESTGAPSFWAADGVASEGYRCYKTLFQVQHGYRLADGTWEWLSVFTGLGTKPRITGRGAEASIDVVSKLHLLERTDAEAVRDTDVTLEDCIPPTGDGSIVDFESTSTGVDHATDIQVNAVSITKGSGVRTSNENELDSAGNTGRLAIALDTAPGAGQTVKVSLVRWLKNQLIETLLGLIFDAAGITSGERSIAPIVFLGGVSGSVDVDTEAEWEAGSLLTDIDTNTTPGSIQKDNTWDDFSDNQHSSNPAWTVDTGAPSAASGALVLTLGDAIHSAPGDQPFALQFTHQFAIGAGSGNDLVVVGFALVTPGQFGTSANGYELVIYRNGTGVELRRNDGSTTRVSLATAAHGGGDTSYTWKVTRDGSGVMSVYRDGVLVLSATDNTYTTGTYLQLEHIGSTGTSTVDAIKFEDGAAVVYESEEFDLLAAPSAWGTLDYSETLNGGTVTYKTNVASAPGGPYDGWVAIDGTTRVIQSNLKRYLKVQITITPSAATNLQSPVVHSWLANFSSTTVYVSLANHRGRTGLQQTERYLRTADYELAVRGDGTAVVRAKDTSAEPAIELDQENGIIDVLAYDDGIPDRCVRAARVRHGEFVSEYDGADAGASAAVQAEEAEIGGKVENDDLSDVALALDVNLAAARARAIYEGARRSATDPRPRRRLRLKIWLVPWLELGDVVRVAFYDNPYMRQYQAADPLHRVGPYLNWGDPGNVLAKDEDFKVLEYNPDYDTRTAELLAEELPA